MARVYFNPYIDPNAGLDPNMNIWSNPYGTISPQPPKPKQNGAGSIGGLAGLAGGGYLASSLASSPASIPANAVSSLSSGGFGFSEPAVTEAVSNLATSEPTSLTNFAGSATPYLGAAGTALGAYSALQGIKKHNPVQAGLGGLGGVLGMNAMGYTLGVPGIAATVGIPILAALGSKFFDKPSTRDIARKHTKELLGTGADNPTWQNYVSGMRKQYDSAPPDPSKPFAGKYATWQDYKKGGLEAGDLTGVYGNLKTFGPDWASYDQGKRQAITQKIIDAGLYDSKKGEVVITDEKKAKEIAKGITSPPPTKNFRKLDGRK